MNTYNNNSLLTFANGDKLYTSGTVYQLVDVLQVDLSSIDPDNSETSTRKKYDVFRSGTTNEITSSLFQTIFDQDNTLQTSNEMLDITIGSYVSGSTVSDSLLEIDSAGKMIFDATETCMMREKIDIYRQYAKELLGSTEDYFTLPYGETITDTNVDDRIDDAIFINIKRLFSRDGIVNGSFAMKMYSESSGTFNSTNSVNYDDLSSPQIIFDDTDIVTFNTILSGKVGTLVLESGGEIIKVGQIWYDKGIIILDSKKVIDVNEKLTGNISVVSQADPLQKTGTFFEFWKSCTIDDILDHICSTLFGRSNDVGIAFKNKTKIYSSIFFCRAAPSQMNFSYNPTFIDEAGQIRTMTEDDNNGFTFITTVGLYDAGNNLLAVAKTSRPIEKNPTVDITLRIRLDF